MLLLTGSLCTVFSLSTLPSNRSTLLTERVDPVAFLLRTSQSVIGPRPLVVVVENGVTLAVGHLCDRCYLPLLVLWVSSDSQARVPRGLGQADLRKVIFF